MEQKKRHKQYEFSLRSLDLLLVIAAVILCAALIFIVHRIDRTYAEMRMATEDYISWQDSAADMREGSDYLSEEARSFAVTANAKHLNNYFDEAFNVRRRGKAVTAMRSELLEDTEAYEALQSSLRLSTEQMVTELYSMRLVIDAQGYNIKNYPEELQHVSVKWIDSILTQEEKMEKAQSLLFDDEYMERKAQIKAHSQLCINALVQKTAERQQSAITLSGELLFIQRILVGLLLLVVFVTALVTLMLVIKPLYRGIAQINANKQIDIAGAREIRFLARAYNIVFDLNQKRTKQLAYDATHDALTGVYNRSGYDALCEQVDLNHVALLLLDIDHFKEFNDNYGHDAGDRVLCRVTSVLALHFRGSDHICRIGGDEFVILMENMEPRYKTLVRKKAQQINDTLKQAVGGLPPVTLSVGVAFGTNYDTIDDCFKAADDALYHVKNSGRDGISFAV